MKYRVIGDCRVAGVEPGGVVELDAAAVNIPALIEGGHIAPIPAEHAEESTRRERRPRPGGEA
ncbi:hypothetical protein [Microtetraspora malaysiensis]|uniref:hypothetical protein n=1 Tax=Microtetraspora malaysiensis TaxID=161358 RepID=UPI003D930706